MMFSKRKSVKLKTLYLKGIEIEWVDNFKYLGVILDNKLLWTKHIDKAKENATIVMARCRRMVGNTWGPGDLGPMLVEKRYNR